MKKITIAFIWSEFMAALAGCFFGLLLREVDLNFWWGPGLTVGVTTVHGWIQARQFFMAALGERKSPRAIVNTRNIPVSAGGVLARFESTLPGRTLQLDAEANMEVITPTGVVIGEEQIKGFVGRALTRQLQGKPGLSRKYWTRIHRPPWDRESYESMVYCLVQHGFIQGRVPGKTGKLTGDYRTIVNTIKRG